MALMHRKSKWQRALRPVTDRVDTKTVARSGLTTAVGALGLTATSAVISAIRRRSNSRRSNS